jgi:hypothetical protein
MAWARRGGKRYNYRHTRRNGVPHRQYVGTAGSLAAHLAAAADDLRRAERRAELEARRAEQAEWQSALTPLLELGRAADLLLKASLFAAGFHQHSRSSWRKKNHVNTNRPEVGQ